MPRVRLGLEKCLYNMAIITLQHPTFNNPMSFLNTSLMTYFHICG